MLRDFNMIATTDRINESGACSELWMLLRAVGDDEPAVDRMGIWGLICARTTKDPVEAITSIDALLRSRIKKASAILRLMPIQRTIPTELDKITNVALELSQIISSEDTFRITVEKRRTSLGHMEIIDKIAEKLNQRVDLENPSWVILVEIIGKITGVSVIRPARIINIQKLNYQLAVEAKKSATLNQNIGQGL